MPLRKSRKRRSKLVKTRRKLIVKSRHRKSKLRSRRRRSIKKPRRKSRRKSRRKPRKSRRKSRRKPRKSRRKSRKFRQKKPSFRWTPDENKQWLSTLSDEYERKLEFKVRDWKRGIPKNVDQKLKADVFRYMEAVYNRPQPAPLKRKKSLSISSSSSESSDWSDYD